MDIEELGNAIQASAVISIAIVVGIAAIIYAVIKKKKNYDSTGVPKRVEKLDENEGTTENGGSQWGPGGPVKVVGPEGNAPDSAQPQYSNIDQSQPAEGTGDSKPDIEPGESDHE